MAGIDQPPWRTMPRNLLFVNSYKNLGGGETTMLTLAIQLAASGWNPHLLVPDAGEFSAAWEARGWPVHIAYWRAANVYFVPALWGLLPGSRRMEAVLRQERFAAAYCEYHGLPLLLPAASRAGVPVLWICTGWRFRPRPWQREFFRRPAATFAETGMIRDGFLGEPPFMPVEKVEILNPGVDCERFRPRTDSATLRAGLEVAPETPLVVLLARFQNVKGHDVFQDMARLVARDMPQAQFLVAGNNPHTRSDIRYREQILTSARNDPLLRDRLRYLGFRPDTERIIAAADVVVCSSWFEGYGSVIVEAMASGRPVVSTNRGGPSEIVLDGETGFLVPPGDSAGLAQRVTQLLRDDDLRLRMGAAGRRHVLQHFTAGAYARRFEHTLERVLAAGRA
ncbi:MAG: glycosyltransferase family 4 protein [Anaerolineaceae bacterium]|nr:glycosyltransferase family 4 protein [Anaerolineaceae bacterium]